MVLFRRSKCWRVTQYLKLVDLSFVCFSLVCWHGFSIPVSGIGRKFELHGGQTPFPANVAKAHVSAVFFVFFSGRNDISSPGKGLMNFFHELLPWFFDAMSEACWSVICLLSWLSLRGFSILPDFIGCKYELHFKRAHFDQVAKPRFAKNFLLKRLVLLRW